MHQVNFSLKKNNKYIIKEDNLKCIKSNKIIFKINNDKYTFFNDSLIKETSSEIITLDFKNSICNIYLKEHNHNLYLKLDKIKIKKEENFIQIDYFIETENTTHNIITIEYTKSS